MDLLEVKLIEKILQNVLKNEKFLKVSKIVLVSLLAAGVLTLAVTAPGALRIFQPFVRKSRHQKRDFQKTKNILSTLKNRRLIDIEHSPEGWVLKLTEKGKEHLYFSLSMFLEANFIDEQEKLKVRFDIAE